VEKKEKDQSNEYTMSDDDIARSVKEGHTLYFEILINRYSKRIINFIHKMIFDYDEAKSISQDVFIKVFESLDRYKTQDNFQAFIFTIAKNMTLNYIKKQKRMLWFSRIFPTDMKQGDHYFQTKETQHESLEQSRQDDDLTEALKHLDENQRIALILKIYLDMPYNKISEITGWTIPKIETLIFRAKSNLKNIILKQNVQENKSLNVVNVRTI